MKKHGLIPAWLVPVGVLLVCGALFANLIRCQVAISSKEQELASVQAQLAAQVAANDELQRALDSGEDAIIERIAREQGYAKPNERIFIDISGK